MICKGTDRLNTALSSGMKAYRLLLPQQEVWAGGAKKQ